MQLSGIKTRLLSSTDVMYAIEQELSPIKSILQDCFKRVETKASAMSYFQGLISSVERKNSWQLSEQAGCENPYAFQYLLGRASWDAQQLRDSVRKYTFDFMSQEGYSSYKLRAFLESYLQPYVLAVASNCTITIGFEQYKATVLLESFERDDWQTISAGAGSKGQRYYQWARKIINSESPDGWERWLLIRRNTKDKSDVAFYIAFAPNNKSLQDMAKAAGSRWNLEQIETPLLEKKISNNPMTAILKSRGLT